MSLRIDESGARCCLSWLPELARLSEERYFAFEATAARYAVVSMTLATRQTAPSLNGFLMPGLNLRRRAP